MTEDAIYRELSRYGLSQVPTNNLMTSLHSTGIVDGSKFYAIVERGLRWKCSVYEHDPANHKIIGKICTGVHDDPAKAIQVAMKRIGLKHQGLS